MWFLSRLLIWVLVLKCYTMACRPCQEKAERRRQAMMNQIAQTNPKAAEKFNNNVTAQNTVTNKLPRREWATHPITNTTHKPKTIWNEWYQTFVMNNK